MTMNAYHTVINTHLGAVLQTNNVGMEICELLKTKVPSVSKLFVI